MHSFSAAVPSSGSAVQNMRGARGIFALLGHLLLSPALLLQAQEADVWTVLRDGGDTYHNLLAPVRTEECLSTVLNMPLNYFFDVIKGTYRVGILGRTIQTSHPEFVQMVSKRIVLLSGEATMEEVPVVDAPLVFTHVLAAVQVLAHRADRLWNSLGPLLVAKETLSFEMTAKYHDLLAAHAKAMQWRQRPHNMSMMLDTITVRTALQGLKLEALARNISKKKARLQNLLQVRKDLHLQHHNALLTIANKSHHELSAIQNSSPSIPEGDGVSSQQPHDVTDEMLMYNEHMHHLAMLEEGCQLDIEVAKKRTRELSLVERHDEPMAIRLMEVEHELARKETSQFFDAIFNEVGTLMALTFHDGKTTWNVCMATLAFLIIVAAILELAPALRALRASFTRRQAINTHRAAANKKYGKPSVSIEAMTLSVSTKASLVQLAKMLRAAAKSGKSKLPYVLFYGEAGTGKTLGARAVALDSGLSFTALSGADLQALGVSAGLHLRQLLDAAERGNRKAMVIIDEADLIIATREGNKSMANPCLFSLLQAMRENSSNLCIVITTRKPLSEIDSALLNRLDKIEQFGRPAVEQRLEFALRRCISLLLPYFELREIHEFKSILQTIGMVREDPADDSALDNTHLFDKIIHQFELSAELLRERVTNRNMSPEMDRPIQTTGTVASITSNNYDAHQLKIMIASSGDTNANIFVVEKALDIFLLASVAWSYRDLEKFFACLLSSVMGTHECKMTLRIWLLGLHSRVDEALTLKQ